MQRAKIEQFRLFEEIRKPNNVYYVKLHYSFSFFSSAPK